MRPLRSPLFLLSFLFLVWIPEPQGFSLAFSFPALGTSTPGGSGHAIISGSLASPARGQGQECLLGRSHAVGNKARPPLRGVCGAAMQVEPPPLEGVKNVRDLASVADSPVQPGRVFRAACLGTASTNDERTIQEIMNINTLVDLRSEQEWNGDILKYNSTILEDYAPMFYTVKKSKKSGRPRAVVPRDDPVSPTRTRHLLSVIDENIYKRGVFKKLSAKKKIKAAIYIALSYTKARKVFIDYINNAGLPLLNELILDYGGPAIKAVLQVLSKRENHPVCFYCTAGKDRTGLIAMLVLLCCGVDRESIISDYVLSDSAYADLNDKDAMVGALQQQQLDPEQFLRAPRAVMESTMDLLFSEYGGHDKYLDRIGFSAADRTRLRAALCDD